MSKDELIVALSVIMHNSSPCTTFGRNSVVIYNTDTESFRWIIEEAISKLRGEE